MKEIIHFGLVLLIIAGLAGVGLFCVNEMTKGKIAMSNQEKLVSGQKLAFPGANKFSDAKAFKVKDKDASYYEVLGDNDQVIGYELLYAVQGYQSQVKVLTGVGTNWVVKAICVLNQAETPGLGAEVDAVPSTKTLWQAIAGLFSKKEESAPTGTPVPAFQKQYAGKDIAQLKVVKQKTDDYIESLSGATITSVAVTDAVREPLQAFIELKSKQ